MPVLTIVFFVLVAVAIVAVIGSRIVQQVALQRWPTTDGQVIELRRRTEANVGASQAAGMPAGAIRRTVYIATVGYTAPDGGTHEVRSRLTPSFARSVSPGDLVTVCVSPKRPSRAVVRWRG